MNCQPSHFSNLFHQSGIASYQGAKNLVDFDTTLEIGNIWWRDMKRLADIGFEKIGRWVLVKDQIDFELTNSANAERVLYAFISNDDVLYIGKTGRALRNRMYNYKYPDPTQSTNIKNNANIREALCNGGLVEIWALADRGQLQVGEFKINMAAGLEDDLITKLRPPWNGRQIASRTASPEKPKSANAALDAERQDMNLDTASPKAFEQSGDRFEFLLRKTYYDQGFFNVSVAYENLFAANGAPIEIRLGGGRETVHGYVNRSVNNNNTPRIMGGRELRDWFQRNFKINGPVQVDVLSKTTIWIHRPN